MWASLGRACLVCAWYPASNRPIIHDCRENNKTVGTLRRGPTVGSVSLSQGSCRASFIMQRSLCLHTYIYINTVKRKCYFMCMGACPQSSVHVDVHAKRTVRYFTFSRSLSNGRPRTRARTDTTHTHRNTHAVEWLQTHLTPRTCSSTLTSGTLPAHYRHT
jgi:hypothetical protein